MHRHSSFDPAAFADSALQKVAAQQPAADLGPPSQLQPDGRSSSAGLDSVQHHAHMQCHAQLSSAEHFHEQHQQSQQQQQQLLLLQPPPPPPPQQQQQHENSARVRSEAQAAKPHAADQGTTPIAAELQESVKAEADAAAAADDIALDVAADLDARSHAVDGDASVAEDLALSHAAGSPAADGPAARSAEAPASQGNAGDAGPEAKPPAGDASVAAAAAVKQEEAEDQAGDAALQDGAAAAAAELLQVIALPCPAPRRPALLCVLPAGPSAPIESSILLFRGPEPRKAGALPPHARTELASAGRGRRLTCGLCPFSTCPPSPGNLSGPRSFSCQRHGQFLDDIPSLQSGSHAAHPML